MDTRGENRRAERRNSALPRRTARNSPERRLFLHSSFPQALLRALFLDQSTPSDDLPPRRREEAGVKK
jgi:hypothetical protein